MFHNDCEELNAKDHNYAVIRNIAMFSLFRGPVQGRGMLKLGTGSSWRLLELQHVAQRKNWGQSDFKHPV